MAKIATPPDSPEASPGATHWRGLEALYEDRIIGGRGAFVVTAEDRASFAEAVKRKLILEISGEMPKRDYALGLR